MGKKRCRKTYRSKGQRPNVSTDNMFDIWSPLDRALFRVRALSKKKRVMTTVPNPDKTNTKERFIRVPANG